MAWTREQIEAKMRKRVGGISDEEIRNADRHAIVDVVFIPPLSAEEAVIADQCWDEIIGERLRSTREE
jgi:hypothetical protein